MIILRLQTKQHVAIGSTACCIYWETSEVAAATQTLQQMGAFYRGALTLAFQEPAQINGLYVSQNLCPLPECVSLYVSCFDERVVPAFLCRYLILKYHVKMLTKPCTCWCHQVRGLRTQLGKDFCKFDLWWLLHAFWVDVDDKAPSIEISKALQWRKKRSTVFKKSKLRWRSRLLF